MVERYVREATDIHTLASAQGELFWIYLHLYIYIIYFPYNMIIFPYMVTANET